MDITGNQELVIRLMPVRGRHYTREQAKELLEGLRAAYESLLPTKRIMIRRMIAQSAQQQFAQEMNEESEKLI